MFLSFFDFLHSMQHVPTLQILQFAYLFHLGIHISFALKLGIGIHIFLLWNEYILFKGSFQIFDAFSR